MLEQDMAEVEVMENRISVSVKLVPEVKEGDWVLIHAGFAMEIIDEELATETLELWEEIERHAEQ